MDEYKKPMDADGNPSGSQLPPNGDATNTNGAYRPPNGNVPPGAYGSNVPPPNYMEQNYYNMPPPGGQKYPNIEYTPFNTPQKPLRSGQTVTSLVLGILSDALLVFTCCFFPFISFPCSIVGLILGIVGYRKDKTGMGIAGIITNGVGLLLSLFAIAFFVLLMVSGDMASFFDGGYYNYIY